MKAGSPSAKHVKPDPNEESLFVPRSLKKVLQAIWIFMVALVFISTYTANSLLSENKTIEQIELNPNIIKYELIRKVRQVVAASATQTTSLPGCYDLMNANHTAYRSGEFLTGSGVTVAWIPRFDASRELTLPNTCVLKRYTADEARMCLKSRHLLTIGDSLSRYQVVAMAHLLEHGRYAPRFGYEKICTHIDETGNQTCSTERNIMMEVDYKDWDKYHVDIGGSTGGGLFNGRLECQCTRKPLKMATMRYVSPPLDSANNRAKVSFVGEWGWGDDPEPLLGWKTTGCAEISSCRYSAEFGESLKNLSQTQMKERQFYSTTLRDGLQKNGIIHKEFPDADILVYNRGIWGAMTKKRSKLIFPLMKEFVATTTNKKDGGRCFWKGTTVNPRVNNAYHFEKEQDAQEQAVRSGCSIFNSHHLTKEFGSMVFMKRPESQEGGKINSLDERSNVFWDLVHYNPWVYEELNNVFLNMLCNTYI